ncbi:MAG TPA: hypothetical protein VD999_00310 [Vitreimonas sp.]|nr:hypothetical protein [Vitreimonas sp.]
MRKEIKVFPQTVEAMKGTIDTNIQKIKQMGEELRVMGNIGDGDMLDEALMHQIHREQELRHDQNNGLNFDLALIEVLSASEVLDTSTVKQGHRVKLEIKFADGDKEIIFATVGSTYDSSYLAESDTRFTSQEIMVSLETPLAQAIIGAPLNSVVTYRTDFDVHKVKVLNIEPSFLFNLQG